MRKFNWEIWIGFLLCVFALLSYPFLFVNWAVTRDFPWANLILFAVAALLVFLGIRRAFASNRSRLSKIVASGVATLSVLIIALFIFAAFVASRWLPPSTGAPQVAQKAPDFSLIDTTNRTVSLNELLSQPINGKPTRGALLIFYRGYW